MLCVHFRKISGDKLIYNLYCTYIILSFLSFCFQANFYIFRILVALIFGRLALSDRGGMGYHINRVEEELLNPPAGIPHWDTPRQPPKVTSVQQSTTHQTKSRPTPPTTKTRSRNTHNFTLKLYIKSKSLKTGLRGIHQRRSGDLIRRGNRHRKKRFRA